MRRDAQSVGRRAILAGLALASTFGWARAHAEDVTDRLSAIERRLDGRLGLWAEQAGDDHQIGGVVDWRPNERFLMCSTFKTLAVATLLRRVDQGLERLDRRISFRPADMLDYAPVTRARLAEGAMSLEALCAAAIELSDNTAANLILANTGGPPGVTTFIRSLGDYVTRLDRIEPALNSGEPGEPRDTTTPASMAGLWRKLLLGGALSPDRRDRLLAWLTRCQTGANRLASITPKDWRIAHKTGSGPTTSGDVALWTPPAGAPIFIAVYVDAPKASDAARDSAIAEAGRITLGLFAQPRLAR